MGLDDDSDCVEHVWKLTGISLDQGPTVEDLVCLRCRAVSVKEIKPAPGSPYKRRAIPGSSATSTDPTS